MLFTPSRRDRFDRDVGPDAKGSKPGMEGCIHQPNKSGVDPLGAAARPKSGIRAAAINGTIKRKFRDRVMLSSLSWFQISRVRVKKSSTRRDLHRLGWPACEGHDSLGVTKVVRVLLGRATSFLALWNRAEVGWRDAVFRCGLVGGSDLQERRLRKRAAEEHDPKRKFCRDGADQARTIASGGIADSVEHMR